MQKDTKITLHPAKLIPPDIFQCQAEKPNGHSFMTLGGVPGYVRCMNVPFYVATENKIREDRQKGSMSLCEGCSRVMIRQLGADYATLVAIAPAGGSLTGRLEHKGPALQSIPRGTPEGRAIRRAFIGDGKKGRGRDGE